MSLDLDVKLEVPVEQPSGDNPVSPEFRQEVEVSAVGRQALGERSTERVRGSLVSPEAPSPPLPPPRSIEFAHAPGKSVRE